MVHHAHTALGLLVRTALGYVSLLGVLTLGNIPRADAISGALWMTLAGLAMLGLHTLWGRHQDPLDEPPFLDGHGRAIQPGDELLYHAVGGRVILCAAESYGALHDAPVLWKRLPNGVLSWVREHQADAYLSFAPGSREHAPEHYTDELRRLAGGESEAAHA